METKNCQNCKQYFVIEPEDFKFYEKIKVPSPTWCPECRMMRRMMWRNERALYHRKCDLCHKDSITMYPSTASFPVYCSECWWSDKWDAQKYAAEYDFKQLFFKQYNEFASKVPHEALQGRRKVNSDYANFVLNSKDAYLSYVTIECENVLYCRFVFQCKDSIDCSYATKINECLRVTRAFSCSRCTDSMMIENCRDVHFSFDSTNCSNCYGCINLRHKSYHIFNKPYGKEEYTKKISELRNLPIETRQKKVVEFFQTQPRRGYIHYFSENVSGEEVYYSVNCRHCYLANFVRDSAYILNVSSLSRSNETVYNVFDAMVVADINLGYELIGGSKSYRYLFGIINDDCIQTSYSMFCYGSQNLFGCIGLRKQQYCILNKQYTKEEYERLVPRIIEHMNSMPHTDSKGRVYRYGEFFPPEFSPFAYNETIAQEYFLLTKEEAEAQGYRWKDPEPRNYEITLKTEDIPDHIKDVRDSILKDIIQCSHWPLGRPASKCNEQCTQAFRIIPQELEFYKKMNLPLPRLCPNCRHYQRIKQRNPLKLWHRKCMCEGRESRSRNQEASTTYTNTTTHFHGQTLCPNEFETSYAPERPEIVYCEDCYQQEVV